MKRNVRTSGIHLHAQRNEHRHVHNDKDVEDRRNGQSEDIPTAEAAQTFADGESSAVEKELFRATPL